MPAINLTNFEWDAIVQGIQGSQYVLWSATRTAIVNCRPR